MIIIEEKDVSVSICPPFPYLIDEISRPDIFFTECRNEENKQLHEKQTHKQGQIKTKRATQLTRNPKQAQIKTQATGNTRKTTAQEKLISEQSR